MRTLPRRIGAASPHEPLLSHWPSSTLALIGVTPMFPRPKLYALGPVGLALLPVLVACSLTSEPFQPEPIDVRPLEPAEQVPPPAPAVESTTDCGSELSSCEIDLVPDGSCDSDLDCESRVCASGACASPSCTDARKNGDETEIDCGGACPACTLAQGCARASDCASGACGVSGCGQGIERCCQAPSCEDGVQNGDEPVTDCGNKACGLCPLGSACDASAQCTSELCQAGTCRVQPCEDGARNGAETDTDCGGNDPRCARCEVGDRCDGDDDCQSRSCVNGACSDCNDGQRNGTETGVDCGGVCGLCGPGETCGSDAQCQSGACQDGRCCGGLQLDCTRCARRLVSAINCNTNGPAAAAGCQAFLDCLADNPAACPVRHAPGCSEEGGVCNHNDFGGNGGPGVGLADAILGSATCDF
jgi:hypothetical protein